MIKFLRNNQQIFISLIFLYSFISVFSVYFTSTSIDLVDQPFSLPLLSGAYFNLLSRSNFLFIAALLISIILIFSGFYLVRMGINYLIISQRSQFSALFFIAISSFCFREELFNGAGIASIFLLLTMDRVIGSLDQRGRSYRFLDAGLLLALGSLFYLNLIFLLPFLWVAQLLLRPFSWRELVYTLGGISIPVIYLLSGAFILDKPVGELFDQWTQWIALRKIISTNLYFLAGIGFYLLMMVIGSFYAMRKFATTKIQSRKLYQLLFFLFVNIILILLLVPSVGIEIMFLLAIPASVLLSIYFTDCRNSLINRLIFIILLLIPLALNIVESFL
jgi:hypothetical protein